MITPLMEGREDIHNKLRKEEWDQYKKWGKQDHSNLKWLAILIEEVGEIGKSLLEGKDIGTEIIQTAAVCTTWFDCLLRFGDIKLEEDNEVKS